MQRVSTLLLAVIFSMGMSMAWADERPEPASWVLGALVGERVEATDTLRFPALDLAALAAEDRQRQAEGEPVRFAWPHAVSVRSDQRGSREQVGDQLVWRLRVLADQASLINFGFHDVHLPPGSRLFIYSGKAGAQTRMDRHTVIGPYDERINREHGEFWTPNLQGDEAIIEVNVPIARSQDFRLELVQVSHGYRGFGEATLGYRQDSTERAEGEGKQACELSEGGIRSGACNQDVACLSEDDPWNDPRRAVGAYQRSGVFACTGSLVNNTANDQRLLFMTARHCISPAQTASVVVYWDYEWPSCRRPGAAGGTSVNPPDPNLSNSGATFLASTSNPFQGNCTAPDECSDVFLMELNGEPNPEVELHWAGWDRRPPPTICAQGPGNSTAGLCATIHHPGVHEKRITWVAQNIQVGNIAGAQNIHWHPFWHPNPPELPNMPGGAPAIIPPAVTEGGSSGSPLYSADRRLLGVLSGGPAFCGATGANLSDFYGGVWHAWEGMGTATTRIRDYLDPLDTGVLFMDGSDADGFRLAASPMQISQCGFDPINIDIDVTPQGSFADAVNLSLEGLPAALSASFSVNPVTPPGTSVLSISELAAQGASQFSFQLLAASGEFVRQLPISVLVSDTAPGAAVITSPANGAIGVPTRPLISWSAELGIDYELQVAADAGFAQIVYTASGTGSSHEISTALDTSRTYFVRVRTSNDCGSSEWSTPISFSTLAQPGDCPIGSTAIDLLSEGFDGGVLPPGWSTQGSVGAVTWVASSAQSHSGSHSVFAQNIASASDQRLTTPVFSLPADAAALYLNFHNWQSIESGTGGCFDGGFLEVSTNNGASWTQVVDQILVRPYDGPISTSYSNPLGGRAAWCGDPRTQWERYSVDLASWAGQDVQFRFRFGTDTSVPRTGWYVDSVNLRACMAAGPLIFQDSFETED